MSDKSLVVTLPEDLIERANAARLNMSALLEKAILTELAEQPSGLIDQEALVRQVVPPERLADSLRTLREGKRILGLSSGEVWTADDFDDPLPDEEWGDLFQ